ncbi:phosphatidate cytidylyltransferase [Rhodothalassium salexigens DSM 2132]|uniref:Phosphatidate cytidylyltransferase n=1 Tax=Rhodothalassium salexigens DSM 2132 TaxID=1188247 RepID=A0A4R2PT05_RHOSA|nr:phosphatidate cytidylyltransferase [Rhodothalassium salexigens]MBB4210079.1 phosphatidate cytidylyltransferase [Rhodothalassium salexigens DSM 2132]MBK1639581.1 hypothetical protein [Rhodothalassium salexigens DSM 2132]TCP38244.1 phosphatidate cytidylyltransferase [Rhodothalassium salexigens DSM 2132]
MAHRLFQGLLPRILSALVLIPLALGAVSAGGPIFAAMVAVAGLVMATEFARLFADAGWTARGLGRFYLPLNIAIALALPALTWGGLEGQALVAVAGGAGLVVLLGWLFDRTGPVWGGVAGLYVWLPCFCLAWMRGQEGGLGWVVWAFLLVWATDIGGYFAGKLIGGPKLMPRVSPNKTWAGAVGGLVCAAASSAVCGWVFEALPLSLTLGMSLPLAAWSQLGDMAESAIKRRFGVKDSGRLIPGHGGMMDRVDGLVFVTPVLAATILFL